MSRMLAGVLTWMPRRVRGICLLALASVLTWMALAIPARPADNPDRMTTTQAAGVSVRVIRVDLADARVHVTPMVARGFPGGSEAFSSMVARAKPTIAINGAYFSRDNQKPIGDIVIGGQLVSKGLMGTALAITPDNRALIRRVVRHQSQDWSAFESVLACGPALVLNGGVDVHPAEEGFRDPHVMGAATRMGVGLTAGRELLIVNTLGAVTFEKWAQVMKALGCSDAMNLDAGASLAMYYRGRTLIPAGRPLTNLLLVYVGSPPPVSVLRSGAPGLPATVRRPGVTPLRQPWTRPSRPTGSPQGETEKSE